MVVNSPGVADMDKLVVSLRAGGASRVVARIAVLDPMIRVMEVDPPGALEDMANRRDLHHMEALVVVRVVDMVASRVVDMVVGKEVAMEEKDTRFDSTTKLPRQRQINVGPRSSIGPLSL